MEPRFNEVAGDRTNSFVKSRFVISRFFFIYFTITGEKDTVCYIEVFVNRGSLNQGSTVVRFDYLWFIGLFIANFKRFGPAARSTCERCFLLTS